MKKLSILAAPLITLAAGTVSANMGSLNLAPYAGFDVQSRDQNFTKGVSKDLFEKKSAFQSNFFVGTKFNDCFGIEASYFQSETKSKNATVVAGDDYFSNIIGADSASFLSSPAVGNAITRINTTSKYKINGFQATLIGFLPINHKFSLFAGVGVSRTILRLSHKIHNFADSGGNSNLIGIRNNQLDFSKTKTIPRIIVGAEHLFTKHLGVRGSILWEQMSKFKNITPKTPMVTINATTGNSQSVNSILNLQNSMTYGLGLFYKF